MFPRPQIVVPSCQWNYSQVQGFHEFYQKGRSGDYVGSSEMAETGQNPYHLATFYLATVWESLLAIDYIERQGWLITTVMFLGANICSKTV